MEVQVDPTPAVSPRGDSQSPAAWRTVAGMLLVAMVAFFVFRPALDSRALSLDDHQFLTENRLVQDPSFGSAVRFFGEILEPSTVGGYYTPLTMTSLMVDHALGGRVDHLRPFRRTNLALHALNGALLVLLLTLLFRRPEVAALVGLLFVAHPLAVEPTVWLSERKTLLATFFALISLCCYVRWAGETQRRGWLVSSLVAFVLSLLAKPTTIALPLLLLLLDAWPLRRFDRSRLVEKWHFFAIATLSAVITVTSHANTGGVEAGGGEGFWQVPLRVCRNLIFYLDKIVRPVDLTSFYPVGDSVTLQDPWVIISLLAVAALVWLLILSLRRTRALLVGFLFFFFALLPTLGLVRYSWVSVSDKYVYFPAVGLLLPLTAALVWLWNRRGNPSSMIVRRLLLIGAIAALTVVEAGAARRYLTRWRNSETIFRHMAERAPRSPRAHNLLGELLIKQGDLEEGAESFRCALGLDPRHPAANTNLGNLLFQEGDLVAAREHWERAIETDAQFVAAHVSLAVGLAQAGAHEAARERFELALQIQPDHPEAHNGLALELYQLGRFEDARRHFLRALESKPVFPEAHLNLGILLLGAGHPEPAESEFRQALEQGGDPAKVYKLLGDGAVQLGRLEEGDEHYALSLEANPDDPLVWNNRAVVLIRLGSLEQAATCLESAILLRDDYADARLNLATTRERQERLADALLQYQLILAADPDHALAQERLAALEAALRQQENR